MQSRCCGNSACSIKEDLEVESGGREEYSILMCNLEKERNKKGAEFKIEKYFYKETAEIRCKYSALLELLEKSEESEENMKEMMCKLEELIQSKEKEHEKEVSHEEKE